MNLLRIITVCSLMRNLANRPDSLTTPVSTIDVSNIREGILLIAKEIEHEQPVFSNHLIIIKDNLFKEVRANYMTCYIIINPFAFGQGIEVLDILQGQALNQGFDFWSLIHPQIAHVSKKLFLDGSYANAACDAFIEINDRVKKLFVKVNPNVTPIPDGDAAMKKVFSANSPLLRFCNTSTDTGFNIQKGFMEMLAGAMSALRNPKAHANIPLDANDAMRRLIYASLLMYKIDEAVSFSGIIE